ATWFRRGVKYQRAMIMSRMPCIDTDPAQLFIDSRVHQSQAHSGAVPGASRGGPGAGRTAGRATGTWVRSARAARSCDGLADIATLEFRRGGSGPERRRHTRSLMSELPG